jgi:hypothetical protein
MELNRGGSGMNTRWIIMRETVVYIDHQWQGNNASSFENGTGEY